MLIGLSVYNWYMYNYNSSHKNDDSVEFMKLSLKKEKDQLKICQHADFRIKDGAYYCYCAYVLRISRHSDFLSVMLTNIGIFLRSLKLSGESRS